MNKTYKWTLPVEVDTVNDDYYVTLPEDLLAQLDWTEGNMTQWVDDGDGSFTLTKFS